MQATVSLANILIGAALALISAWVMRWWQFRRELYAQWVKAYLEAVDEATTVGIEYWLTDGKAKAKDGKPHSLSLLEAQISGLEGKIGALLPIVASRLCDDEAAGVRDSHRDFMQALTGGNFGSRTNSPEPDGDAARLLAMFAADLHNDVITRTDFALSLRGSLLWSHSRSRSLAWRKFDPRTWKSTGLH